MAEELRYEFRAFDSDLSGIGARLAEMAAEQHCTETSDIYLLTTLNPDCGIKHRDGRLDAKLLKERRERLELWEPVFQAELPIKTETFERSVLPLLKTKLSLPRFRAIGLQAIVRISKEHSNLACVDVKKARTKYMLPLASAEWDCLVIQGIVEQSICVEATVPNVVERLITETGLAYYENRSYPRHLNSFAFG